MSLDLIEAPPAMPEPPPVERERMLGLSLSGRSYVVLEVHHHRIGPGDSELDWALEVFEFGLVSELGAGSPAPGSAGPSWPLAVGADQGTDA